MPGRDVPGVSATLTADGTADGYLVVADTTGFMPGADAWIQTAPTYQLVWKTQTVNFTVGDLLTGGSSGATGTIVSQVDGGATGTLVLQGVTGTFTNNEAITDPHGGAAVANGTQAFLAYGVSTEVTLVDVASATQVGARTARQLGSLPDLRYGRSDMSSFTLRAGCTLYQPPQYLYGA